ncbi:hypothetical protein HOY80DRAFT_1010184 [Tuber brumale]|nr:hypothetical protein HOY80DRAFT_1010184 [Tuber brumale]
MSSQEKPGSPAPPSSQEPKDEDEEEMDLINAFMSGEKTFYSPLPPVKPTPPKPSGSSRKRVAFAEPREEPSKAPKIEHRQISMPMPAELMVPNSRRTPWKALPCTLKRQNPNYWWSAVTPEHRIPPVLNENESGSNSRLGNSSQGRLGS